MKKQILIACAMLLGAFASAQPAYATQPDEGALQAAFGAQESGSVYYSMGWDTPEEAKTWHYEGISNYTWTLTEAPTLKGTQSFATIDPSSKYSLSIKYSSAPQCERAVSPEIEVLPGSQVDFYACFSGIWLVFADWKLLVNDVTAATQEQLMSGFYWAQENSFTGPNWIHFNYDLSKFAGHTCTFEFKYEGADGDDMSIDGFKLIQKDNSEHARINIMQGQQVHFEDQSLGHPTAWNWSFEGGTPAVSTEQHPVVTFEAAGEYAVSLTVSNGGETSSCVKEKYVVVSVEAPQAHIGLPEGAYLSPWAAAFVPLNVPVTFQDASTGSPDSWNWTFEGTDIAVSTEQHPTVTYTTEGQYGLVLDVKNAAGQDRDFLVNAIKAGGALDVWNIEPEEYDKLDEVMLGWYGSYAGSNWLGLEKFAEHFEAPMAAATVDAITVYFASNKADDAETKITVSLCLTDDNGMPGEVVASASKKVSELAVSKTDVLPTVFALNETVEVKDDFFVVIEGFPNTGYTDDVSVLCVLRNQGQKSSTYHLLQDEDEHYNLLDTYTWYENVDDPLSMALTAHLAYVNETEGLKVIRGEAATNAAGWYDLMGRRLAAEPKRGMYFCNGQKVVVRE